MSAYFFSEQKGIITALTGVKALIIPYHEAKKLEKELQSTILKKNTEEITTEFHNVLKKSILSSKVKELSEELNHFRCLVESKVAGFFHIRNVLLRVSYSTYNAKRLIIKTTSKHRIYRAVLGYYLDYSSFVLISYGYIEAQHLLINPEDAINLKTRLLFLKEIESSLKELKGILNSNEKTTFESFQIVSTIIDRKFYNSIFKDVYHKLNSKNCLESLNAKEMFKIIFIMLKDFLLIPSLWNKFFLIFVRNFKLINPYVLGRFKNKGQSNTGKLPAILSEDVTIDPAGFHNGKQYMVSQETEFKNVECKGSSDLLWHILSRCAVVYSFFEYGIKETEIRIYFKKLRKFNEEWSPKSKGTKAQIAQLDNRIISEIKNYCDSALNKRIKKPHYELEDIAISIYKIWSTIDNFDLTSDNSNIRAALNCTYMHI